MAVAEDVRRTRPERVPPHNLEAEDFYRAAHQRIFESVLGIYARGEPVDAITVVEDLKRRQILEGVGGPLYVYNLVESVPTPASAGYYARIVSDHALLRRLIEAASQIMSRAYTVPEDPKRAADWAEQLMYSVARQEEQDQVISLRELVDESMADLEHIQQRDSRFAGVPTGFEDLDGLLSGLQ